MTRRTLVWLVVLAALIFVLQAVLGWSVLPASFEPAAAYVWLEMPLYIAAVVLVLRDRGNDGRSRRATTFILIAAAVFRIMLLPAEPASTDINRYVWDGRVQGAGINPYVHIPADPALQVLRDDKIYPNINRKDYAPTIYPPLAQIIFFLTTRISEKIWVMKAVMVGFDGLTIAALLGLLRARGSPPTRILIYAWHPVPIWQFAADGHVDAVMIACICLAMLAAERRKPVLAGIALGGAVMTKIFPMLLGPALYRRWDWKLPLAGLVTIALLYGPYLGAGAKLFGFSSGYSAEEGLRDGSQLYPWLFLGEIVPDLPKTAFAFYWPGAAAILGAIGLAILLRRRKTPLELFGAFVLAGVFTALTSPHYIWYMAWLVPFLCFYPSWAVFWLTGAATFMNNIGWPPDIEAGSVVFLPFFALGARELVLAYLTSRDTKGEEPSDQ
ncbi:hypothetical protein RHAL1_03369 [Beijerinckiaceae bacterium RH AL1]|nr:glycosyltransferase family 87 protein [Beijerinckiaceae bacterium]VVB48533.1 hypothetical protein RHCH11_RHCH11_03303 [Beijerinckiaceae bacterium RH CH11]VVB48614.1 hypothetical protein RHAL8_03299 [Beijerinckiaceae bacterium RH AL8]VVC56442.1 hypothetical protein RHAL1_03369 [Beijerinckiaceae bacterium RH AL1]